MADKICQICGKPFSHASRKLYCGYDCRVEANRRKNRENGKEAYKLRKRRKAMGEVKEAKKANKIRKVSTIAQINEAARDAGMTYGQYVAQMNL